MHSLTAEPAGALVEWIGHVQPRNELIDAPGPLQVRSQQRIVELQAAAVAIAYLGHLDRHISDIGLHPARQQVASARGIWAALLFLHAAVVEQKLREFGFKKCVGNVSGSVSDRFVKYKFGANVAPSVGLGRRTEQPTENATFSGHAPKLNTTRVSSSDNGTGNGAHTLLRLPEVRARTGLSRTAIYDGVAMGYFPHPVKIGRRASAWIEAEIEAWIADRIASRDGDGGAKS